jgi:hypothetical protein
MTGLIAAALWNPAPGSAATCRPEASAGGWNATESPSIANAFAVQRDGRILAADDRVVYESAGLGCAWRQVWRMPDTPSPAFPFTTERVTRLALAGDRIVMALSGPHVVTSSDGGRTWTPGDDGLRAGGTPTDVVVSPSDGRVVYLVVTAEVSDESLNNGFTPVSSGLTARTTSLYRSADAGASWDLVATPYSIFGPRGSEVSAGSAPGTIWDVKVDPVDARAVWIATNEGLFASRDGGASWTAAIDDGPGEGPDVRAVDVIHPPGSSETVTAVAPASGTVFSSTGGERGPWERSEFVGLRSVFGHQAADPMVWLTHAGTPGPVVASGPKGVFTRAGAWTDVSPLALGSGWSGTLADLIPDPSSPTTFWGRARGKRTIYRYSIPPPAPSGSNEGEGGPEADPLGPLATAPTTVGALAAPSPARLTPARATVRLRPGETAVRAYELALPPRPTPLDLYFLLDSTSSTNDVIRALARGVMPIATSLRARGVDVWAGVGEFRTYPRPGEESFGGEPYNFPYRRDLDVGPPGQRLSRALLAIEGEGASGANLTALYQAATGAGQQVPPPVAPGTDIPPGQGASFRPGALKVVFHVADTWFATPERGDPNSKFPPPTWPGPTFEQAIAALAADGIHHVGAALGQRNGPGAYTPPRGPLQDLSLVSRGTGTLAPRDGVDCDGDDRADVPEGAPLVCGLPYDHVGDDLVPMITGLLEGVRDVGTVRLEETTGTDAVAAIAPHIVPAVDLKESNRLRFVVTFACPRVSTRTVADARFAALLRDDTVARAAARVICRRPTAPAAVPAIDDGARVDAPVVALLPPPPPPPIVNGAPGAANAPAPAPAAEPAPAPAPAPNPQAVPVHQRQVQPQLAFVHAVQQVREQVGMQHAMVRVSSPRSDPMATTKYGLAAGALSILLLWGMATAVARRPSLVTTRSQRGRH